MKTKGLTVLIVFLTLILAALVGYVLWRNNFHAQGSAPGARLPESTKETVPLGTSETADTATEDNTTGVTTVPADSPGETSSSMPIETDVDEKDPVVPTTVGTTSTEPLNTEPQTEPPTNTQETGIGLDDNELPPM